MFKRNIFFKYFVAHLSSMKTENIPIMLREKLRNIVSRSSECRNKISSTVSPNNTIALTCKL